ncbi:GntR family transcriptional regulator [Marinobacterium aestuarii]|uniref:GntR family transcriptional regulator n=1 Tax=Marinobacterium aestuarii TaxID=1821621 RepID=A0A1A9F2E5_9GAMM|nr:S1-like domain-containing RNA-binding protein [Marinobacterium aestuarii]ANG64272.1 GntR family transcriptional regulator [Marinobacterium aestuarii]
MVAIGRYNTLSVIKQKEFGVYLDGENLGEILLPARHVPDDCKVGDTLEVFVYLDSEDFLIATTDKPLAQVGDFVLLRCADVTPVGAFLDWGLPKQLLVPFSEQPVRMQKDKSYLVYIYLDNITNRIVATTKLDRFLDRTPAEYKEGEAVELTIANRTDLGIKAVVNGTHWGLIHQSDLFRRLHFGQNLQGYIKQIRPDGKLDLCLDKPGYGKVSGLAGQVLERLKAEGGYMAVNDKTDPQVITRLFGSSKKAFKMAIGTLYKQRLIDISPDGIRLIDGD